MHHSEEMAMHMYLNTCVQVPEGLIVFPSSASNQIFTLQKINTDKNCAQTIARSYDGGAWESLPPGNVDLTGM